MSKAKRYYLLKKSEEVLEIFRSSTRRTVRNLANTGRHPFESSASPIGTEEGLKHGQGAGYHDTYLDYVKSSPAEWRTLGDAPFDQPIATSLTTLHPVLDVRVLARESMVVPGRATAHTLVWPRAKSGNHALLLVFDYRDEEPFVMIAHNGYEPSDPSWQRIEVALGRDRKPRFICPFTKSRVDMLYLRNAAFASATAQRLYHPSQRSPGFTPQ